MNQVLTDILEAPARLWAWLFPPPLPSADAVSPGKDAELSAQDEAYAATDTSKKDAAKLAGTVGSGFAAGGPIGAFAGFGVLMIAETFGESGAKKEYRAHLRKQHDHFVWWCSTCPNNIWVQVNDKFRDTMRAKHKIIALALQDGAAADAGVAPSMGSNPGYQFDMMRQAAAEVVKEKSLDSAFAAVAAGSGTPAGMAELSKWQAFPLDE